MEGKIKFVDGHTGKWGYIVPNDGSEDVHFLTANILGPVPSNADVHAPVEFEVVEGSRGRDAKWMRLLVAPSLPSSRPASAALQENELKSWAYMPYEVIPFRARDSREYPSVLGYPAKLALQEAWYFGNEPDPRVPILENYFKHTFNRLRRENKVVEKPMATGNWAAFNTGLVDRLYDPIYVLFEENDRPRMQRWRFYDFCVPGKKSSGRKLTEVFEPLPEPAKYFSSSSDMPFDTSKDVHVDYEHVILDGVARNRFPTQFLREHVPEGFDWKDIAGLTGDEQSGYLARLSLAIENDDRCMRSIKRRLEDAKLLAEKRIASLAGGLVVMRPRG